MKRLLPAMALLAIAPAIIADAHHPDSEPDMEKAKQMAVEQCASCHGEDGNSGLTIYPSIAGQHPEYLYKQIVDIRDGHRNWGMAMAMQPLVTEYNDEDVWSVANYMSRQIPKKQEADPNANLELGKSIYRGGIASSRVPACMSCHGPNGAGIPAGSTAKDGVDAYPRLSNQHYDYIMQQMTSFKNGERTHNMMGPISKRLTEEEIEAVSAYIQGLN